MTVPLEGPVPLPAAPAVIPTPEPAPARRVATAGRDGTARAWVLE